MEYSSIVGEPYIWHWTIRYTEVSNNYYVVVALGPKGERLKIQGAYEIEALLSKMVSAIMSRSPDEDRQKYPEYESRIVDKICYIKETVYRLDISNG